MMKFIRHINAWLILCAGSYLIMGGCAAFMAWNLNGFDLSTWSAAGRVVAYIVFLGWGAILISLYGKEKD